MATAARRDDADLLLSALARADWDVRLDPTPHGFSALAVRYESTGPLRITAFARSRAATVLLVYFQARARADRG